MIFITSFILFFLLPFFTTNAGKPALIINPVADLVGQSIGEGNYKNLALCTHPVGDCQRIHQALFNEMVLVEQERAGEVCITFDSVYFQIPQTTEYQTTYWTLKKNILYLNEFERLHIPTTVIPPSVDFHNPNTLFAQDVVTLAFPFFDPTTHTTYSAGTRFAVAAKNPPDIIQAYAINPQTKQVLTLKIPSNLCITTQPTEPIQERKKKFVSLIKSWANQSKGYIPYVWGGCSFCHIHKDQHFKVKQVDNARFYNSKAHIQYPYAGFDCAGMIVRAAHICAIPYFFKNTATLARNLKEITHVNQIEPGDLIWFPGHVMVISNVQNPHIIEARAYSQGYGRIHELKLNQVLKNINSFEQLLNAISAGKTLERLQRDGSVAHTITTLKLFKFP